MSVSEYFASLCLFFSKALPDPLEKEMATHSSILAWEIPWTKESGRLQSMGLQESGQNLVNKPSSSTCV